MLSKEGILICVVASLGNGRESLAVSIGEFLRFYAGGIEYDPISVMSGPEEAELVLDSGFYKAKQLKIMTFGSLERAVFPDVLRVLIEANKYIRARGNDTVERQRLLEDIAKVIGNIDD